MILQKAQNNRYGCTTCGRNILRGSRFFRSSMNSFRASHTVNICSRCIVRMHIENGVEDQKLIAEIKKEISEETKKLIVEELRKGEINGN